jgi:heterodisulfide reductase subunit A
MKDNVGAVLVVGGGIAGMQASLDLAESGFKVYLLDKSTSIGGVMAQLDKTFPTNDCAMCIMAPKLVDTGRHPNIELLINSDIKKVEGEAGHFKIAITKRPLYVNEEKCNGCGTCGQKCPMECINPFNENLDVQGAISVRYPQAVPLIYAIDRDTCIGCGICREVCKAGAIEYDEEEKTIDLDVGSIILCPGFEKFDPRVKGEYGYGRYANVISSIEFERMLSASGPYGGMVLRPSDGEIPERIAFIQCVGSRDANIGSNYCSSVCCMYATKEAVIAREHHSGINCHIFFMDMRAFGKEFEDYYVRAKEEYGIKYTRSRVSEIREVSETKNLILRYEDEDGEIKEEEFDLAVLSVGMRPPKDAEELSKKLGIELNEHGFCATKIFSPLDTSRPGVFVCGAFSGPKDIPESVAQASGAAAKASGIIASERNKLITIKEYPPERDVKGEEPRIGAFICHCGINIGGVVNVPEVTEYAKTLPNVVYAENNLYTCSQDAQERIKEKIKEHNLNRVVVASCTPRTHEPLFRDTVREGGLNQYLFEMANIRDQCSWVHMHEPEKATEKAKELVRMAVAKARLLEPLYSKPSKVIQSGLVIGGGLAGMTAALELAKQEIDVYLVEKEAELGGRLRNLHYMLDGEDPQEHLKALVESVNSNERIQVYTNAEVTNVEGYVGNFKSTITQGNDEKVIEHGIVIVATGAQEYKPEEYLYGSDPRVITQLELEEKLAKDEIDPKTVVIIQCVGSRGEKTPYCSKVCCSEAIKNALKIKERNSNANIYILYKDMMTYGFREEYYKEAAEQGIIFIRYDDDNKPEVSKDNGALKVSVRDRLLKTELLMEPDLLVLSAATLPNSDNERLSQLLKVPLSKDGFFQEAHVKLRPIDFATEGVFLCGLAHSPRPIDEIISQACATASRAMTLLSKEKMELEATVSFVDEELCIGCGRCVEICMFDAISLEKNEKGEDKARINDVICKGCGTCASVCPNLAITPRHFERAQIHAMIDGLLVET